MLHDALDLCTGPAAIRWPRTAARVVDESEVGHGFAARKGRSGDDVCLIGVGKMFGTCLEAAELLAAEGVEATVWDPRLAKPLDTAMLDDAGRFDHVITVEDGLREGGIGSNIALELAVRATPGGHGPTVTVCGTPTEFLPHGDPEPILASLGLDAAGVASAARRALG